MPRFENLLGQTFTRLRVIEDMGSDAQYHRVWKCLCDPKLGGCGNIATAITADLKRGHKKSCGCYSADASRKRFTKHGGSLNGKRTRAYATYDAAKQRCQNPRHKFYSYYGGRGIKFLWKSFEEFLAEMGEPSPGLTLDRYPDNNGPYGLGNCRWATRKEQQNNRRSNRRFAYNNETHTVSEWAEKFGIPRNRLRHRLDDGWSIDDALTIPTMPRSARRKGHVTT